MLFSFSCGVDEQGKRFLWNRMRLGIIWQLALLSFVAVRFAGAQAAGEYAGAVSSMGLVGVGTAAPQVPEKLPFTAAAQSGSKQQPGSQSKHLPARNGEPVDVKNRRELEKQAGKDAGKLLVRSDPAKASVWIDGKLVGDTPILLVLAPGQYKVELRGSRLESAQDRVDLLPGETREIVIKLEQRYPAQVRLR